MPLLTLCDGPYGACGYGLSLGLSLEFGLGLEFGIGPIPVY